MSLVTSSVMIVLLSLTLRFSEAFLTAFLAALDYLNLNSQGQSNCTDSVKRILAVLGVLLIWTKNDCRSSKFQENLKHQIWALNNFRANKPFLVKLKHFYDIKQLQNIKGMQRYPTWYPILGIIPNFFADSYLQIFGQEISAKWNQNQILLKVEKSDLQH